MATTRRRGDRRPNLGGVALPVITQPAGEDCSPPKAGTGIFANVIRPILAKQVPCLGAGIPYPDGFIGCQDASVALTDERSAGDVVPFTLPGQGAVAYGATVPNWTVPGGDKWASIPAETSNLGFYVVKATGGDLGFNLSVSPLFMLDIFCLLTVTGTRVKDVFAGTAATSVWIGTPAAGTLTLNRGGTNNAGARVFKNASPTPVWQAFIWDPPLPAALGGGSGRVQLDAMKLGDGTCETLQVAWGQHPDGGKGINNDIPSTPPVMYHNLKVWWRGAKARQMMARGGAYAGGRTLISNMGVV